MSLYRELTDEMVQHLQSERKRTGIGAKALLKPYQDLPKNLNEPLLTHMLGKRLKRVRKNHYDFVVGAWATLPDNPRIEITEEMRLDLIKGRDTSKLSADTLVRLKMMPKGLTKSKYQGILSGSIRSASVSHYEFLKTLLVK